MSLNSERFQKFFPGLRVPKNPEERERAFEIVKVTIEGNLYRLQDSVARDKRQRLERRSQKTEELSIIFRESHAAAIAIGYGEELNIQVDRTKRKSPV